MIVAVFRARIRPENADAYYALADEMAAIARSMPGFISWKGYFAEDGIYHNVPTGPVQGREKVRAMIAGFIAPWTETEWEILHLVSDGNLDIASVCWATKVTRSLDSCTRFRIA